MRIAWNTVVSPREMPAFVAQVRAAAVQLERTGDPRLRLALDGFGGPALLDPATLAALGRALGTGAVGPAAATGNPGPVGEAQSFIQGERQRLEAEKYNFTPEQYAKVDAFNAKREAQNDKVRARAGKVEAEMLEVEGNPRLEPKEKAEKLAKLGKKHAKILEDLKPPVDLHAVTQQVDAIMNDPNISDDDKKKRVEEVRKKYDLPEHEVMGLTGGVNMHDLFTGRLGKLYKGSADRIKEHKKAQVQQLKAGISAAEKIYGKESTQALALKSQLEHVEKMHEQEEGRLRKIGDTLWDMYRPKSFWESLGSFFSGVFKVFGKIVDFVMPVVKLIPGVGQIAGAVWGGVKAVGSLIKGDWQGALSSVLDVIPGVGGVLGKVVDVAAKGIKLVQGGINTVGALVRGDVGGALGAAAGVAGGLGGADVADVLGKAGKVAGGIQRTAQGDVLGGLQQAAGGAAGSLPAEAHGALQEVIAPVARVLDDAGRVVSQVEGAVRGAVAPQVSALAPWVDAVRDARQAEDLLLRQLQGALRTIRV